VEKKTLPEALVKCLLFPDSELKECHVVAEHRVSHHHVNLKEHKILKKVTSSVFGIHIFLASRIWI
jgi:hypothetical protein